MDFDSPEVMKDFPGLYSSEKRKGNDSDYNDQNEKSTKKEMIIGKRKDKKDKDKGYAALEGESSDEASPCKAKKSKAFIFSSKSKDKEKDKEKEHAKGECSSKTAQKKKAKHQKFHKGFGNKPNGGTQELADALPIFGADLSGACLRGKCHDGIPVPLPVRECIDFVEAHGLNFESIYKVSGNKNKVNQIKKMYNSRQRVTLKDFDIPTVTSAIKAFFRDLPEPLFTNDLLVRFEEAGAILNYQTRGKHLCQLVKSLPEENRQTLSYLIIHLDNIVEREQVNKMNKQNISQALNNSLQISSRLLQALISHRTDLFVDIKLQRYQPPLEPGDPYPDNPTIIKQELFKLESAINLIHWEIQQGFSRDEQLDHLWEVQRVQTELKRKLKKIIGQSQTVVSEVEENEDQSLDSHDAQEEEGAVEYDEVEEDERLQGEQARTSCKCGGPDCTRQRSHETEEVYYSEVDGGRPDDPVEAEYEQLARDRTHGRVSEEKELQVDIDSEEDQDEDVCETSSPGVSGNTGQIYQNVSEKIRRSSATERPFLSDSRDSKTGKLAHPGIKIDSVHQSESGRENRVEESAIIQDTARKQPRHPEKVEREGAYVNVSIEDCDPENVQPTINDDEVQFLRDCVYYDSRLAVLQAKNDLLVQLSENLSRTITREKQEIDEYKKKLDTLYTLRRSRVIKLPKNFDEIRELLIRENHLLEIKKVQLVSQIMEHKEQCVNIEAKLRLAYERGHGKEMLVTTV